MDNAEKKVKLAELINDILIEFPTLLRRPISQNEVAVKLGVDITSFSQWSNQQRLPSGNNIYKLGAKLKDYKPSWSQRYWAIMEIPEPIDLDPKLRGLIDWWPHASEPERQQVLGCISDAINRGGKEKSR